jgi:16S rRNA (uracil1498-N3)-methyltransferase
MRFSIAKVKNEEKKIVRWNKIAESAAKQSKRNVIPLIEQTIKFNEMIKELEQYDLILVAYENESKQTLKNVLEKVKKDEINNVALIIGPEGGVDSKEIDLLIQSGAECISLGKRILRTETAPLALLSMLVYEFEL